VIPVVVGSSPISHPIRIKHLARSSGLFAYEFSKWYSHFRKTIGSVSIQAA
jgi:hypothetical protein